MRTLEPDELFRDDAPWFEDAPPAWLRSGGTVSIYGAGGAGRDLARALGQRGVSVRSFIDQTPRTASIEGIPVISADRAPVGEGPLLLGLHNPMVDVAALGGDLDGRGFSEIRSFPAVYRHLAEELGDRYFLAAPSTLRARRKLFEDAAALFDDEHSRKLFWSTLAYRWSGDVSFAPSPDLENQYFPRDISFPDRPLAFVDAGAYVGDTLEYLRTSGLKVARVTAFEPDTRNYRALAERVREFSGALGPVSLLPCAVSDETGLLSFSSDGTAASRVDPAAAEKVLAVRLDEALAGYRVNFVKMDVEGAEMAALRGARDTLRRDRPALAISTYHKPLDHAEVPLLVA